MLPGVTVEKSSSTKEPGPVAARPGMVSNRNARSSKCEEEFSTIAGS